MKINPQELHTDNAFALHHKAEFYYSQGKLSEAYALCRAAIKINPDFAEAYNLLGKVLLSQGKISPAIRSLTLAIEIKPDFADAHANLGTIFYQEGRLLSAISSYQKALAINPNNAGVYWNLAKVLKQQQNRLNEAIACQQKALELKPDLVGEDGYLNLGNSLAMLGQLDSAIRCYQKALQLDENYAKVHLNLGVLLRRLGKHAEAINSYQQAIAINPNFAEAHFSLANAFSELGKLDEAITSWDKALELKPDIGGAETHINIGNTRAELGKLDEAMHSYQKALKLDPNSAIARMSLGIILRKLDKIEEAVSCYQQAIALNPYLVEAHFNLANALNQLERFDEAIAYYIEALQIQPNFLLAYYNLGDTLTQLNRKEEANICYDAQLPINLIKEFIKTPLLLPLTSKSDPNNNITYIDIHPKSKIYLSPPQTPDGNIHENFQITECESPETFVALIPNGRVWGDSHTSAVFTSENKLLEDVSQGSSALIFYSQKLPAVTQIDGTVAFLSVRGGPTYFHWMCDLLPRIELLRQSGIDQARIDKFVVNSCDSPFQRETLNILGIPQRKIIESSKVPHIRAKNLVVPSFPRNGDNVPKWTCEFLRSEFIRGKASENSAKSERIYISRQSAVYRRILNEDEVVRCLSKFGFISVSLETLSFREQVSLFAAAKVVVAPHGAGLTNTLFCGSGTKVIEIFSPDYMYNCYWLISNIIGLEHYYLLGECLENYYSVTNQARPVYIQPAGEDIFVNIYSLLNLMKFAGVV